MDVPVSQAALARLIQAEADGPRRDHLLELYHARNISRFGTLKAEWYRQEYEWIRAHTTATDTAPSTPEPSPKTS